MLALYVPLADEVTLVVSPAVEFIDHGGNFERVECSRCGAALKEDWWSDAMDAAYETRFANLLTNVPCCGETVSLNDLRYVMPAGFARFVLTARNPGRGCTSDEILNLEQVVGCKLRVIWARY